MRAVLKLEFIAENYHAYKRTEKQQEGVHSDAAERYGKYLGRDVSRPWCARITGPHETYGLAREFVKGQIDYSKANSVGSRGVFIYYALKDGLYEVNERTTWSKVRRYFIHVEDATITEIAREEVMQWVSNPSGVAFLTPQETA